MTTITREWIVNNLATFQEILAQKQAECPICYESFEDKEATSPLLSDTPSKCTHWACKGCWEKISNHRGGLCPFCREDLRAWFHRPSNKDAQDYLINVMCLRGGGAPIIDQDTEFKIEWGLRQCFFSSK